MNLKEHQGRNLVQERKYIVFETELLKLFSICPACNELCSAAVKRQDGSLIEVQQQCHSCDFTREWLSQPYVRRMPAGNLILSSALLLTGALPAKTLRVLKFANIASISRSTYHRHQEAYLAPAVIAEFQCHQQEILSKLEKKEDGVELAGDGRYDSPGFLAKYGIYSVLEESTGKIIDTQLVQVITNIFIFVISYFIIPVE
jgi:solute carrier family 8 (sodium/calcium exchanger)